MLKKTVTYKDYNDVERTEDFYFNITRTELMELETSYPTGISGYMNEITASNNTREMVKFFRELILKAYGEKTPDGRRFLKSKEISEAFYETPAYDQVFQEILSSGENGLTDFILGIMPADIASQVAEKLQEKSKPGN